jgi:hypothetical protein
MAAKKKNPDELTPRQHATVLALLTEGSIEKAAVKAGVSVRSVYTWLEQEKFLAAYHKARYGLIEGLVGQLLAIGSEAIATLREALSSPKQALRIRSAGILLERITGVAALHGIQVEIELLKRDRSNLPASATVASSPDSNSPAGVKVDSVVIEESTPVADKPSGSSGLETGDEKPDDKGDGDNPLELF